MAAFAMGQLHKVAISRDTKDARFLLQHNPITRQDFQDYRGHDRKVQIAICIPRSETEVANMGFLDAASEHRLKEAPDAPHEDS